MHPGAVTPVSCTSARGTPTPPHGHSAAHPYLGDSGRAAQPTPAPAPAAATYLPAGSQLSVELDRTRRTERSHGGERFTARVDQAVVAPDGAVAIPDGGVVG